MTSKFKKLIHKEFGKDSYERYFRSFQKKLTERRSLEKKVENEDVYRELYITLRRKEAAVLQKMAHRLEETMSEALMISRSYLWTFLFYLVASLFLIAMELHPWATLPALILISAAFIYKTYEFVVNKYCYIDAYIILVYKAALERVLQETKV